MPRAWRPAVCREPGDRQCAASLETGSVPRAWRPAVCREPGDRQCAASLETGSVGGRDWLSAPGRRLLRAQHGDIRRGEVVSGA